MARLTISCPAARQSLPLFAILIAACLMIIPVRAGDANYFALEQVTTLPATLSSLLVQSPVLVNVPAGATLSVTLLRNGAVMATSRLKFNSAYNNNQLVPPVPLASFYPTGSNVGPGQPLPGATLTPGLADLDALAAGISQYQLLWVLSDGVIATPSRAVATSTTSPLNLVDLKLAAISAALRPGDQKPGSVLIYNRYTSSAANPAREDSSISLSNTSLTDGVYVRLFLINGTCQPVDYTICLSPRQTVSLLASDLDPGSRGYMIAVACDSAGQPLQHNWLTGSVAVKQPNPVNGSAYDVTLSAVAIAKRTGGVVAPTGGVAEMAFDDVMYDRLPAQVGADDVPSQTGGLNNTTLVVFRPLPNLAGGIAGATFRLTGSNNSGESTTVDVSATNACYKDIPLSTLRTTPKISDLIPPGSTAWFSVAPTENLPVLGAQFNYGRFSSGGTTRALSYLTDYRIRIPVTALACP
ncbi:MAG: hypothetical protein U0Z53_05970 [Blastocatellia bacterium]